MIWFSLSLYNIYHCVAGMMVIRGYPGELSQEKYDTFTQCIIDTYNVGPPSYKLVYIYI